MLSVIIPAHNEEGCVAETVTGIYKKLQSQAIQHEIIVVNDHSTDKTAEILKSLQKTVPTLAVYENGSEGGFGRAVRWGLDRFKGDVVAVMMADRSDSPDDLVSFYRKILEGYDCVFGSRFIKGGQVIDYPKLKLYINRMANTFVRFAFQIGYNDVTNAFKMYKRQTIEGIKPFLAPHFNLTLEMPLKAIVRGYSYAVLPNSWTHRKVGASKLKIKEMGSRYFFIFLYCLIEKYFSRGDFKKNRETR